MNKIHVSLILLFQLNIVLCARILVVLPGPGYSQYMLAEPLVKALLQRGHYITVISGFQTDNHENLKQIKVKLENAVPLSPEDFFTIQDKNIFSSIKWVQSLGIDLTENLLVNPEVQQLLKGKEKFDLVLVETFLNEAHLAFANHFNAHLVLFNTMGINEWNSDLVGNPILPSYFPHISAGYSTSMSFKERFRNSLAMWFDLFHKHYFQYPIQQQLVDKYFPEKLNLDQIIYNASLLLTCSHVSTGEAQPLTTSVVEVGGLHIVNKTIPEKILSYLDSATEGVIFFSLGSNVQSRSLPKQLILDIIKTFGTLKQKVLWKFENENYKDIPENVMISKWFPQNDILSHPNTILFITHCGLGSTTEAIYHGVPVLGIPIFGDQFMNMRRLKQFGLGLELPFKNLSAQSLKYFIHETINNPVYAENAKKRSRIMRDRPMKPLDLAVYWVEYVLQHEGAHHLKNSLLNLNWFQLYSLDVISVIILLLITFIHLPAFLIKKIRKRNIKKKLD
ncbi:hypothetical protein ABEB36_003068 [Hypothenemus hampei]|uniref:UDP-glucuronosyltransferase n=1 Tax=Hypothenemus hampei TaxID=57062 RepID=A0ABD1F7Y2_HYPHA